MSPPFEPLRERLLRAGVAPVHVRRYLRELSEHYADLSQEEQEAGRSPAEAQAAARARLGGDQALAEAMLAQPGLRSWTARAPWATLVIGPFLLLILAWIVPALLVVLVMFLTLRLHPGALPPAWLPPVGGALLNLVQFGGPLLIACGIALLGARQRTRVIWPLLGCAAVASFGDSLLARAIWPTAAKRDMAITAGIRGLHHDRIAGNAFSLTDWSPSLPLIAFSLVAAAAVYWLARAQARSVEDLVIAGSGRRS
jgi:hypothetical protein